MTRMTAGPTTEGVRDEHIRREQKGEHLSPARKCDNEAATARGRELARCGRQKPKCRAAREDVMETRGRRQKDWEEIAGEADSNAQQTP